MWSRRVQRAIACLMATALVASPARSEQDPARDLRDADGLATITESFQPEMLPGLGPIEIRYKGGAGLDARVADTAALVHAGLERLGDWLGPYPYQSLTVIETGWNSPLAGASYPGTIVVNQRWLTVEREALSQQQVLASLARQYWFGVGDRPEEPGWFHEGLVLYTAGRAIDESLSGRLFATSRFFGGVVPFSTRSLPLSLNTQDARPRLRRFAAIDDPPEAPWRRASAVDNGEAQRAAVTLHSLERAIGWPALQQGLFAFRERTRTLPAMPDLLADVLTEQRGEPLPWVLASALRAPGEFDFAIESMTSARAGDAYETTIAAGLRAPGPLQVSFQPGRTPGGSIPIRTRFADGSIATEWWDASRAFAAAYTSASPAIEASVDPDTRLLVDPDRRNNTTGAGRPYHANDSRVPLNWLMWLQDLMLTYSALV